MHMELRTRFVCLWLEVLMLVACLLLVCDMLVSIGLSIGSLEYHIRGF